MKIQTVFWVTTVVVATLTFAQDIVIDSISRNGTMSFQGARVGTTATVEWAANLTDNGGTSWHGLTNIIVTSDTMTSDIPMFFRVRGAPDTNLLNGLMAYYPFNANANDESGNHFDGVGQNVTPTNDRHGVAAQAYWFNGLDSLITVSTAPALTNSSFTISAWLNRAQSDRYQVAVGIGQSPSTGDSLSVGFSGIVPPPRSNNFVFAFYNDDLDISNVYSDTNMWHLWTCTYEMTTGLRQVYRDGILVGQNTATIQVVANGPLYIGNASYGTSTFAGMIDEVRIYNRALPSNDVYRLSRLPY